MGQFKDVVAAAANSTLTGEDLAAEKARILHRKQCANLAKGRAKRLENIAAKKAKKVAKPVRARKLRAPKEVTIRALPDGIPQSVAVMCYEFILAEQARVFEVNPDLNPASREHRTEANAIVRRIQEVEYKANGGLSPGAQWACFMHCQSVRRHAEQHNVASRRAHEAAVTAARFEKKAEVPTPAPVVSTPIEAKRDAFGVAEGSDEGVIANKVAQSNGFKNRMAVTFWAAKAEGDTAELARIVKELITRRLTHLRLAMLAKPFAKFG